MAESSSAAGAGPQPDFPAGAMVVAKYRDDTWRKAKVIETAKRQNDDGSVSFRYYIHYETFNRRMDTWVNSADVQAYDPTLDAGPAIKRRRADRPDAAAAAATAAAAAAAAAAASNAGAAQEVEVLEYIDPVEHDEHEGMDEDAVREHEDVTKVKNIGMVELGRYRMETWYFSPFPKELYPDGHLDVLYMCEFSLRFFRTKEELRRWQRVNTQREIYRHNGLAMFEIDGALEKEYSQNLCYLAKLFLDHKTLYFDVDPFLFYVMCELDERGHHVVGYFSKEKYSDMGYNLACILTFPCHQRKGYGRFLIDFSYALSKLEAKVGSPEKPLSDLGLLSYRSYWAFELLDFLNRRKNQQMSIMDITKETSIHPTDIMFTMQYLNLLKYVDGQHIIAIPPELVEERLVRKRPQGPVVDMAYIRWVPYRDPQVKKDKWLISAKKQPDAE